MPLWKREKVQELLRQTWIKNRIKNEKRGSFMYEVVIDELGQLREKLANIGRSL